MSDEFLRKVATDCKLDVASVRPLYKEAKAAALYEGCVDGSSKFYQRVFELTKQKAAGIQQINE